VKSYRGGFMAAKLALIVTSLMLAASGQAVPNINASAAKCDADMPFMLLQTQTDVQGALTDLDLDVENAVQNLSTTDLKGPAAHEVLRKLLETNSNLAEVTTFDKDGKIAAVEEGALGINVSSQEVLLSMHSAKNMSQSAIEMRDHVLKAETPVFTPQYRTAEGYNATVLAHPVFSPQGELLGGITATIRPDKLLNAVIAPKHITEYTFLSMHLDGLMAYDQQNPYEIGKYLFTDPLYKLYPSLLTLGKKIIAERSGHGYYSFPVSESNKTIVDKECYWTTVVLHGREWRLFVTKMME
jgi:polar amino acid transport system substrate-binding protein